MFNAFKPLFETLRPADVNELAENIVAVLQGQGGTLQSLTRQTAALTTTIAERDETIGRVLDNLTMVSETANRHRTVIGGLNTEVGNPTTGESQESEAGKRETK